MAKVIYFDSVYPEFKKLIQAQNKYGFELSFWAELNEKEKNNVLNETDYFLVAATKITKDLMQRAPKLKLIQKTGIGYDNIDIKSAAQLNIPVCNAAGGNATGVSEMTIALILGLYRKLNVLDKATKNGEWHMWSFRMESFEMKGKTHGIIGFGNIGKATAKLSQAFGTKVIYYDKFRLPKKDEEALNVTYMGLDDLLRSSDIISIHIPLLPETIGLIEDREFSLMKENAVLINVARGEIVDEGALANALEKKLIRGAGIDTWASEPVDKDNPLLKYDNVIATPHVGAGTKDTIQNILRMSFANIEYVENGLAPKYVVNGVRL